MSTTGTSGQQQAPWTIGRLLEWTTKWFQDKQIEGGRLAAELLLARALGCKKIELYTRYEEEPKEEQRTAFRELVKQAGEHTPIAYLLGFREFFSLEFKVTPAVLIPRPETEALVERVIGLCRQAAEKTWRILDVGTGSGCIALAVAKYAKNANVVASDISEAALAVAGENIQKHQLGERVRTVPADLAQLPAEAIPEGGFDIIASNPPYISAQAYGQLPPNVRDHEPKTALVGPNGDGLVMYRRFAAEAPAILAAQGRLLVEIGHDQHEAVKGIFAAVAGWEYVGSYRNQNDPYERVVEVMRA